MFQEVKTPLGRYQVWTERPSFPFHEVKQVHSSEIIPAGEYLEADGVLASYASSPCGMKTADCLSILLEGPEAFILLHAGWRGLFKGILEHPAVLALQANYAYLGPSISADHYEVGLEFKDYFGDHPALKLSYGRLTFDLSHWATSKLTEIFPEINIETSENCTFDTNNLHSFRRDRTIERNFHIYIPDKKD